MEKISSPLTFYTKRVMPAIFFGFLIFATIGGVRQEIVKHQSPVPFIIGPLVMSFILYLMFRKFVFDLADEVWDAGDNLIIRKKGAEEKVDLRDVINVNDMTTANWPRVTLLLRKPCRLGDSISFYPKGGISFFGRSNPIATDLIRRIDVIKCDIQFTNHHTP